MKKNHLFWNLQSFIKLNHNFSTKILCQINKFFSQWPQRNSIRYFEEISIYWVIQMILTFSEVIRISSQLFLFQITAQLRANTILESIESAWKNCVPFQLMHLFNINLQLLNDISYLNRQIDYRNITEESMTQNVTKEDFVKISLIGKGTYAKVFLAKKKEGDDRVYALKQLLKKYIQKRKQEQHVMMERNILAQVDHPFIVKLHYSFQSSKKLYFALQYCPGGELFTILSKQKRLSEEAQSHQYSQCQVLYHPSYTCSRVPTLQRYYLSGYSLKPQNILLDTEGYVRLADFGLSRMKIKSETAMSVCGTPQYLAPEILYSQGHGKPVDWWCLGSLIYQMTVGLPPFYETDRSELFQKIKFQSPVFPNSMSKNLRNLIEQLLHKKPQKRLGSKKGAAQIKKHPWFGKINEDLILSKKMKAPYIPVIKSKVDVSNFDKEITQCDIDDFCESPVGSQGIGDKYQGFSFDKNKELNDEIKMEQEVQDFDIIMESSEISEDNK